MSTSRSRVLSKDEVATAEVWDLPVVDGEITACGGREIATPLTAAALQEIQKQAYNEGFDLGRREGREAGHADAVQAMQSLAAICRAFARPLEKLDEELERSLVELVILIARQLIRRELKSSPGEVVAVVREAVASLPVASRHPCLHLNPEDVEIVRQALSLSEVQDSYALEGDPLIARGGCLVETATSFIDSTIEARLNGVIAHVFGGVREGERNG